MRYIGTKTHRRNSKSRLGTVWWARGHVSDIKKWLAAARRGNMILGIVSIRLATQARQRGFAQCSSIESLTFPVFLRIKVEFFAVLATTHKSYFLNARAAESPTAQGSQHYAAPFQTSIQGSSTRTWGTSTTHNNPKEMEDRVVSGFHTIRHIVPSEGNYASREITTQSWKISCVVINQSAFRARSP